MSDFAKSELLKVIRNATVAYIDLFASELEAKGASLQEIDMVIQERTEAIKKVVSCASSCESAYQQCMHQSGSNPDVCSEQRTICLGDC